MSVIYLFHPRHGTKIATMEMEAQYDESHGWIRFDPDELDVIVSPEEVANPEVVVSPKVEPNLDLPASLDEANVMGEHRRRGRPRRTQDS